MLARLACIAGAVCPAAHAERPAPDPVAGRAAYEQSCARCHGATGQGDGRDAKRFLPRPRNLTEGVFKFRSTGSGTPPTDDDLYRTVTHGLPAGGMPDWAYLDEAVRWQLVHYVKSLSPVFAETAPEPIVLGRDPGARGVRPEQGRGAYEKLGCALCHGAQGRANGLSAATLVDNWDQPTRPTDLTQGWSYRGGSDPPAILTRLVSGIDGSPMPSYADAASHEELWQVAHYVQSLQEEPRWAPILRVTRLEEALPRSVDDPRWKEADRADARVRNTVNAAGEMTRPQSIHAIGFQAFYNEEGLALRIVWDDPSEDRLPAATDAAQTGGEPADALAVAFRPPGMTGDLVTLQTWPLPQSPALDLCGWSAKTSEAVQAVAQGYDAVWQKTGQVRTLDSQAVYADGQWTLVLIRPWAADHAPDDPLRFLPVAFAVWDGGNEGQQAVSAWVDLDLEEPPTAPEAASAGPSLIVWFASVVVFVIALVLVFRKQG